MDKLTIYVRRYRADITIIGDRILESNQKPISEHTESKSLLNAKDVSSVRQKFIEDCSRSIYNQNKRAELEAIHKRKSTIEKLIIYKIE